MSPRSFPSSLMWMALGFVGCDLDGFPSPIGDPDAEAFEVFVVGDSWAEFAQGTEALYSLHMMPAQRLGGLGYRVAAEHTYGLGGSATAEWAAGVPCDTPGASCSDPEVHERFLEDLEAASERPFVYLSLGGNDLRVAGAIVDFSDPTSREAVFDEISVDLVTVIDDILEVRDDAEIVIAGYANFHFAGSSIDGTRCTDFFATMFSATPGVEEQLVNSLFAGGEWDGVVIDGLVGLYQQVQADTPQVHHANLQHRFAPQAIESWDPSATGIMIDCLHLAPPRQQPFSVDVVNSWHEAR